MAVQYCKYLMRNKLPSTTAQLGRPLVQNVLFRWPLEMIKKVNQSHFHFLNGRHVIATTIGPPGEGQNT